MWRWIAFVGWMCSGLMVWMGYVPQFHSDTSVSWPALPKTDHAMKKWLKSYPPRLGTPTQLPSAFDVSDAIKKGAPTDLFVGWSSIVRALQRSFVPNQTSILLWGTAHDAPLQVSTFSRLLGAAGLDGIHQVIVELFDADGHWKDINPTQQRGDTRALQQIFATGDAKVMRRLYRTQQARNFVGWKYGYIRDLLNLALLGRARGFAVQGCDMPLKVQAFLHLDRDLELRAREMHCALANGLLRNQKQHTAMFWGRAHIGAQGIQRYLPKEARVTAVYVYGGGAEASGMEESLRDELRLLEPLLVPLPTGRGDRRFVLLLPSSLAYKGWRKTRRTTDVHSSHRLEVDGRFLWLKIAGQKLTKSAKIQLSPGSHAFLLRRSAKDPVLVGQVTIRPSDLVRMSIQEEVRVEYHHLSEEAPKRTRGRNLGTKRKVHP